EPGTIERDLRRRGIDANRILGSQIAHAHDEVTAGDEERELLLVEPRHVHVRVTTQPELAAAVVDLGARVALGPQAVALRNRIVEADRRPPGAFGRMAQHSLNVRNAADARRQRVVDLRENGGRHARDRGGHEPWDGDAYA